MTKNAVSAKSISKNYGNLRALDSVSLSVPEGSFFGLLGPNGAGKTTLIGVLGGLVIADKGSAQIMGSDVVKESLAARRKVGIVPQELLYDPFFTVRESLTFQSKYYGIHDNQQWIDTLLTKLNLNDKTDVNTRKLSGGMKRRLMIAQALVHRPPVIVLDEPTAGVDINLRLSLWEFIRDLNRQGHTIILTTHYLEEAETLCEFVALMQDGKVIVRDKTKTLLADCHTDVRVRECGLAPTMPPLAMPTTYRHTQQTTVFCSLRSKNTVILSLCWRHSETPIWKSPTCKSNRRPWKTFSCK